MQEQPHAGVAHDHAVLIGGVGDVLVAGRAAGLGDGADAAGGGAVEVVAEGDEGVAAEHHAFPGRQPVGPLVGGDGFPSVGQGLVEFGLFAGVQLVEADEVVQGVDLLGPAQAGGELDGEGLGVGL